MNFEVTDVLQCCMDDAADNRIGYHRLQPRDRDVDACMAVWWLDAFLVWCCW